MGSFQQILDSAWVLVTANYKPRRRGHRHSSRRPNYCRLGRKLTRKGLERGEVDATLVPFLAKLVYYAVLAVVVIAALNRLGVATTSVVAIFGAAGLAMGLALQGTLSNFASGIMLLRFPAVRSRGFHRRRRNDGSGHGDRNLRDHAAERR